MATFTGTVGNDSITGTSGNDTIDLSAGGNDTASGAAGADRFDLGAALNAADRIDGGDAIDTLALAGDYSGGVTFNATTVLNIEMISLLDGFSYKLTTHDATVAAAALLTVNGSALTGTNSLIFDGHAELDGSLKVAGGAGNDKLTGGAQNDTISGHDGNDTIDLSAGGNDSASGGAGVDRFELGSAFSAGDQIDGGDGIDMVDLAGDYSGGVSFSATTLVGIENIGLVDGNSYKLATNNATVAAGAFLTVNGSALTGTKSLAFDGHAELDGSFKIAGGAGNDALTGGAQNDTVSGHGGDDTIDLSAGGSDSASGDDGNDHFLLGGALTASDNIDGGTGNDTVYLVGNYSAAILTLAPTTLVNVESISLGAGFNYRLATDNATIAAGATLTVDGSALGAGNTLYLDGSAEHNGKFVLQGGAGNDTLVGSWQNDSILGGDGGDYILPGPGGADHVDAGAGNDGIDMSAYGGSLQPTDQIDGGGGNDLVFLSGDYSFGFTFAPATMVNVESMHLAGGHSYKFTTNDATVGAGKSLTFEALSLGGSDALNVNASAETDGSVTVNSGTGNVSFQGGTGNDGLYVTTMLSQNASFNGGGGTDSLALNADYSGGFTFGAATLINVETLYLDGGHSYQLTTNDANVAAGQTFTVTATGLGPNDYLVFNGSAETNGSFNMTGGNGVDWLLGGAQADTFNIGQGGDDLVKAGGGGDTINVYGALTANDQIDGGPGNDTVIVLGNYPGLTLGANTLHNVESFFVEAPGTFTSNDGNVAAGQTLLVTDDTSSLTFNGSAEKDGNFHFVGGSGVDVFTGGSGNDVFDMQSGGNDKVLGGGGGDTFNFYYGFTENDYVNGGAGFNTANLEAPNGGETLTLSSADMININRLNLSGYDHMYVTMQDSALVTGQTLLVDAHLLAGGYDSKLKFDGSAESSANFTIYGTNDSDSLGGGGGTNFINGGANADYLFAASGHDTFVFSHVSDSTSTAYDTLFNFDVAHDKLDVLGTITGVDTKLTTGTLDVSNFDDNLATAVNAAHLGAHHAVLFTPSSGSYAHNNNTFLIVDQNGVAGYQANVDLVIDMPDAQHTLGTFTTSDFI